MKNKSLAGLFFVGVFCINALFAQSYPIYIGTYTSGSKSEGVYVYDFNEKTGHTQFVKSIPMSNPSFIARKNNMLYAVNEDEQGKVLAYDLAKNKVVNSFPTGGAHPCHVSLSPRDPLLAVSNYSGGSLSIFSLDKDGAIEKNVLTIAYQGNSINKDRQNASHVHSAFFNSKGDQLFVSDLGTDMIYVYEVTREIDNYQLKKKQDIKIKEGAGPRHITFSKDEKTIYSVLELTGEVAVLQQREGVWHTQQLLSINQEGFKGEHGAADIKVSSDGKYLFATDRGDANVYAKYKVNKNGTLKLLQTESVQGVSPRNLNISKSGKWLFFTNQLSDKVSVLPNTSKKKTGLSIEIPKPVCIIF